MLLKKFTTSDLEKAKWLKTNQNPELQDRSKSNEQALLSFTPKEKNVIQMIG